MTDILRVFAEMNNSLDKLEQAIHNKIISHSEKNIQDYDSYIETLQQQIKELETENSEMNGKFISLQAELSQAIKIRNIEMDKVDNLQLELENARRDRDLARRANVLTSEQKQALIKLEHESYSIDEMSERLQNIADNIQKILVVEEN